MFSFFSGMGFFASYSRLSKKQKVAVGLIGIFVGLIGPFAMQNIQAIYQVQYDADQVRRENLRIANKERLKTLNKIRPEDWLTFDVSLVGLIYISIYYDITSRISCEYYISVS